MDSMQFYDIFASSYQTYSEKRSAYLQTVDQIICSQTSNPIHNYLDVGAGNGTRTVRLGKLLQATNITGVDESANMCELQKNNGVITVFQGQIEHYPLSNKHDLITCLWNVIGHIPSKDRVNFLKSIRSHLTYNGRLFLDVNNRNNISHYGLINVSHNILRSLIVGNSKSGDFPLFLETRKNEVISTSVHIFTNSEILVLFREAGLSVVRQWSICYSTGRRMNSIWHGQLLYELKQQ